MSDNNVPDLNKLMNEQQQKAREDPSLKGAADLSHPLIELIRSFMVQLATQRPAAVVAVAMTEDGNIMCIANGKGSGLELLGLVKAAEQNLVSRMGWSGRGPPNMP